MPWSELGASLLPGNSGIVDVQNRLLRDVRSESRLTNCLVSGKQCYVCLGYAAYTTFSGIHLACSGIEETPAC